MWYEREQERLQLADESMTKYNDEILPFIIILLFVMVLCINLPQNIQGVP